MKTFISWSGPLSKQVAEMLRSWIEDVLQGTKTWISTEDIEKGSLWFGDVSGQLKDTGIGILCLTRENINAPWILFEAGALSKGLDHNRVCPLLINLEYKDLAPPLSQFNGTLPKKEDMLKLIKTINAQDSDNKLPDERVEKSFKKWWDEFDKNFSSIMKDYKPGKEVHKRSANEMIEEILQITRSLQRFGREKNIGLPNYLQPCYSAALSLGSKIGPEKTPRDSSKFAPTLVPNHNIEQRRIIEDIQKAKDRTDVKEEGS